MFFAVIAKDDKGVYHIWITRGLNAGFDLWEALEQKSKLFPVLHGEDEEKLKKLAIEFVKNLPDPDAQLTSQLTVPATD